MRILILTPFLPYPPSWGFAKRVYHLLEVLSRSHEVTLLSYNDSVESPNVEALRARCHAVHVVPSTTHSFGKRFAQLASLASRHSFQRQVFYTAAMQRKLDELTRGEPFDVIQLESSQMACFTCDRRSLVVLDEHNLEYELYYRMYQSEGSPVRRFFSWLEYFKFKREEIASWRNVDGCVMTSEREVVIVGQIAPGTPAAVVPNAVDIELFKPSAAPTETDTIVFTGLMKYRPNVDGALFFVNEVLPLILAKRPSAVFYIVGAEPAPEVTRLASPHVVVTGSVDDVRPYVYKAGVFVVPLRMGSGTRLKVLEGLAMGKAMVSTALGCEGIDVVDGEHLLVRDDPHRFAAAVLDVMAKPELARTLGAKGRELAVRSYSWETATEALETFWTQLRQRPLRKDPAA